MVDTYLQTGSYNHVIREFGRAYPNDRAPSKQVISYNVRKFRTHGTTHNRNAFNCGRLRTARSEENAAMLRAALQENGRITSRRNGLNLSQSTFSRLTRFDLNLYPYRMRRRHQLKDTDLPRRIRFGEWLLNQFRDPNFLNKIVIGDEAIFTMNGSVNTHNIIEYAPRGEPPNFTYDIPSSREKVTVWAGLCGNGSILGPFFFDANVNGLTYLNLINDEIVPQMMQIYDFNLFGDELFEQLYWFQDGAGAHRRNIVTARLRELFENRVVALHQDVEWPARSPDLTPCDFFLWGYMKPRVFTSPPADIFHLRRKIIHEFEQLALDRGMITRAVAAMQQRARVCIQRNGGHVEGYFA